ncbi:MAG TPA: amidohydrolase family protein [Phycisphaerae bacterium]|nr:amidohydrolase family protein [Phycisphaerae bacterium]HPS53240.1 amidohydrolase family protein [Phycisphaerae bacterium]
MYIKGIDIHSHAFPDAIAHRAMAAIQSRCPDWPARGDGTIAGLAESMRKNNIEKSAVCSIATKPGQAEGICRWLAEVVAAHDCFIPVASVNPDDSNPRDWMKMFRRDGIGIVKLHPMYQNFVVDDEKMYPIYDAVAEYDMLLEFHSGMDIGFPDDAVPDRAAPHRFSKIARKFPQLKMLLAHMGGFLIWDDVEKELVGCNNIWFETSFGLTHMSREQFVRMVRNHGEDKICFGSDWPWIDQGELWEKVLECDLGSEANAKIWRHNAAKLLGVG